MSLPNCFTTPAEYFEESTNFFRDYKHLFNFPNTEILVNDVLEQIDIENLDKIDVFEENFDLKLIDNEFLLTFFEKLNRLQVFYNDVDLSVAEETFDAPISHKKRHEIICLANEIEKQFEDVVVVDFGSGLGYLDQRINEISNKKVLGIECNENHYVNAKKRQRKYHENSIENVKYIRYTITSESDKNINEFLKDKFASDKYFGVTGLHACADLTIDAINLFLKMDAAKNLLILPCCYHKMAYNDGVFKNFPLSCTLKDIFMSLDGYKFLNIPFLRLGAQPPNLTDNLEDSVFNLLARGTLQLYVHLNNCKLKRKKRKAVNTKQIRNDFENYIQDACKGFQLIVNESYCHEDKIEFDVEMLRQIWREIKPLTFKKAAIFILLQNYLQPIIENYILFDRLLYLRENGVNKCYFKKIFNEKLSPRCLALLAKK